MHESKRSEQNRNKRMLKKTKTNTRGVIWDKARQKYQTLIGVNGKTIRLGRFVDLKKAIKARKEGEKHYWQTRGCCVHRLGKADNADGVRTMPGK